MAPLAIVKALDVVKHRAAGCRPVPIHHVSQLSFERAKEAFHWRIVPAVSLSTHTAAYARCRKLLLILAARILAAAVAVMHQTWSRSTLCKRTLQCRYDERTF